MLVIGGIKVVVHKAVDYQEHVTEYGVHWNFFLSLGMVVVLSSLIEAKAITRIVISINVMIVYQLGLNAGIEDFIFNGPRDNFFNMNREGIFGCIGFFCIYQIGLGLKQIVLDSKSYLKNLVSLTILTLIITEISFAFVEPSRRLVIIT